MIMERSKLKKIVIVCGALIDHLTIHYLVCSIVLQIAITKGETMKIPKFFRFLRTFTAREAK